MILKALFLPLFSMINRHLLLIIAFTPHFFSEGTPLVYSIKIRRVFTGLNQFVGKERKPLLIGFVVPTLYWRSAQIVNERFRTDLCDKRTGSGTLLNLRCVPSPSWWVEVTTAIQKERTDTKGSSSFRRSRTGFDDVALSGGYNLFPSEDTQVGLYGLAGIPTKWSVSVHEAQGPLVGSRFYVLGGGVELSHRFMHWDEHAVTGIAQFRALHFFTRPWDPILPADGKIQPGETIDFLLTLRYQFGFNLLEAGYNPTFFLNQALILPSETLRTKTNVRQGCYASIMHAIIEGPFGKPLAIGTGVLFNRSKTEQLVAHSFSWWFSVIFKF